MQHPTIKFILHPGLFLLLAAPASSQIPASLSEQLRLSQHNNNNNNKDAPGRGLFVGTPCSTAADCGTDCGLTAEAECYFPLAGSTSVVTCTNACGIGTDTTIYCVPKCNIIWPYNTGACSTYNTVEVNGCVGDLLGLEQKDFCNPFGCPFLDVSRIPQQQAAAPQQQLQQPQQQQGANNINNNGNNNGNLALAGQNQPFSSAPPSMASTAIPFLVVGMVGLPLW